MLPSSELTSTRPIAASALLRGTATVADPRQDGAVRLDQIAVGKALLAQVASVLADGSSLVRLSSAEPPASFSAELRMQLPAGSKAGDSLKLTLLTKTPQLTFGVSAAPSTDTTPTSLSSTARMIDTLLQQAGQTPQARGSSPLLTTADTQAAQMPGRLAAALHKAVEGSGVFYEAHLRQWADGERTLAQVRSEPQNQTGSGTQGITQNAPSSAQLLPLQLDSLEQRRFAWKGEVWPGQDLQWEVLQQDTAQHAGRPAAQAASVWQTVLQLELPRLGRISARIRIEDQHAQLQLRVQDEQAASELKAQTAILSDAMAVSGTALDAMTVQGDEPD